MSKPILDVTAGSRMFWWDKQNPNVVFSDKRKETYTTMDRGKERTIEVNPDVIADFRKLPFEDNSFHLVVFDPPHLVQAGDSSWLVKKYGKLDKSTWPQDLKRGFEESSSIDPMEKKLFEATARGECTMSTVGAYELTTGVNEVVSISEYMDKMGEV